jgi:hypothetical protein
MEKELKLLSPPVIPSSPVGEEQGGVGFLLEKIE